MTEQTPETVTSYKGFAALAIIVLFGIAGTPDYVLEVERENDALRAKLAKAQNAQLQCRETLVAVSGVSE